MTALITEEQVDFIIESQIKCRFYTDLDGVYNLHTPPFPYQKHEPNGALTGWRDEWKFATVPTSEFEQVPEKFGKDFHICWSPELVANINRLIDCEWVELVFATTWRKRANKFAKIVGMNSGDARFLDAPWERVTDKSKDWWKLELVKQDLIENPIENFIWADDEFVLNPNAVKWATENTNALLIQPSPELGITRELFDTMESYVIGSK